MIPGGARFILKHRETLVEIGPRLPGLQLFLRRLERRSQIGDAERSAVLTLQGQPQSVAAHRDFTRLGKQGAYAYLVVDGVLASFVQLEDGSRQTIALHIPGDMVGLQSMMLPGDAPSLHALTKTTVLQVPHAAILQLMVEHNGLTAAIWRDCIIDSSVVARWLVNVGRKNARSRLAHLICEMAVRYDMIGQLTDATYNLPITQEQIADCVGLTPVHVNRSIQTLREDGLIRWLRTRVTVLDWAALTTCGEFSSEYLHRRFEPEAHASIASKAAL